MPQTQQLSAHYAVLQLDTLREQLVRSYSATVAMLLAELDERLHGVPEGSGERRQAEQRRADGLASYRTALVAIVEALLELRFDCGADPGDLPRGDDDVPRLWSAIRAEHLEAARDRATPPADAVDVDALVDRHFAALVDFATRPMGGE